MTYTRNYNNLLSVALMGTDKNGSNSTFNSYFNDNYYQYFKATNGNVYVIDVQENTSRSGKNMLDKASIVMPTFGDGTTPPSYEDYNLSGSEISLTLVGSLTTTYTIENKTIKKTFKGVYTSTTDVTIREIAIMKLVNCYAPSSTSTPTTYSCLLARKVLETPIQIVANTPTTLQFEFELLFPIPNN